MFMEQRSPGDTVLIPKRLTMKERRGNGVAATIPCYTNEIAPPGILQLSALGGRPQHMLKTKGKFGEIEGSYHSMLLIFTNCGKTRRAFRHRVR
jgi:hypothetical protein